MSTRSAGAGVAWIARAAIVATLATIACTSAVGLADAAAVAPMRAVGAPSADPSVKYYVVATVVDGLPEYLFAVAVKTLGNGNRFPEIFALNKGRVQPDGQRLTDPAVLKPGWVLELPADAAGPDVHFGPLPGVTAGAVALSSATGPSTMADTRPGRLAAPQDKADSNNVLRTLALIATVVVLAIALHLLRRGARLTLRRAGPPRRAATAPSRPARFSTPPAALVAATAPAAPVRAPVRRDQVALPSTAPAAAPMAAPPPAPPATRALPSPALPTDLNAGRRAPRQPTPTDQRTDRTHSRVLRAELTSCGDVVDIRLAGARRNRDHPPYTWVRPGDPFPDGVAVVALGDQPRRQFRGQQSTREPEGELFVDLAASPDVLTVTGPAQARLRQAQSLARQLRLLGVTVVAVDGVLGQSPPAGCLSVTTWDARTAVGFPVVVFLPGPGDEATRVIRRAGNDALRPILVLVGDVRRARWSVAVRPPSHSDAAPEHGRPS